MIGASFLEPGAIPAISGRIRLLTDRPVGINLILKWDQRARLEASLAAGFRLISFHWGMLAPGSPYVEEPHAAGALVMLNVGSADEAKRAVDAGVDIVVAQGLEAGGHVWGMVGSLALVPAVVDAIYPMPVVAAGGIGDGRGLAAVLALGAQAAWMGTRFAVSCEARGHAEYKERIVAANETDAVWSTGVFDNGFRDSPVRTLDNSTLRRWREAGSPPPGQRPGEGDQLGTRVDGTPIVRYDTDPPAAEVTGELEAMANYAGQCSGIVRRIQPAGEIVREVAAQAADVLRGLAPDP